MSDMWRTVRTLAWQPGFTVTAILTLGIGIGLSAAVFSVVDAVMLRPFDGIHDDGRLVIIGSVAPDAPPSTGVYRPSSSAPAFFAWRGEQRVFTRLAAASAYPKDLIRTGSDAAELLVGHGASADFFETLGARMLFGRAFRAEEERAAHQSVVVLTHRLWRTRLGADANVLGTTIRLNGVAHTIIGVLAANPYFDRHAADVWLPLGLDREELTDPDNGLLQVYARLKSDVTLAQADRDLTRIAIGAAARDGTANRRSVVRCRPFRDAVVAGTMRQSTTLLGGVVIVVLLITCANVAHLFVVRYARTRGQVAIRLALGASRGHLVRQFLSESLLICVPGGAVGVLLAVGLTQALAHLVPPAMLPREMAMSIDVRVLGFAAVLCLVTALIFGLLPVWTTTRANLRVVGMAVSSAAMGTGPARAFVRHGLVVAEVALTFLLLSAAALLLGSLVQMFRVDPGFRTTQATALHVTLDRERYATATRVRAYQTQMLDEMRALPGVVAAASANVLPLTGRNASTGISISGSLGSRTGTSLRFVTPDYLSAMGMALRRGRFLTAEDGPGAPRVIVVNETYARVIEAQRDPLGATVLFQDAPATVVGIVADLRHRSLIAPTINEIYVPFTQAPEDLRFLNQLAFVVRTQGTPAELARALTALAAATDRDVPIVSIRTMGEYLAESLAQPRFLGALFGVVSALALGLAAVGVYGVLSLAVSERTREFGIRLALGAQRRDLFRTVMTRGALVTGLGLLLGLGGAMALGRTLATFLFGVSATSPLMHAAAAVVLALVALLACWVPARRATTADPLIVLNAS